MKHFILYSIICFAMCSCNNNAGKDDNHSTANLNIVESYRHAVESKDMNTLDTLLAANYKGYGPSVGDSITKEQTLQNWKNETTSLYESIEYTRSESYPITIESGPQSGDWVANWAYLTIKYKDGRGPVNVWVNATYKIENGKITRSRTFYNEADVLRQLGYAYTKAEE
jgi:ketosteroid isomerase-like protein